MRIYAIICGRFNITVNLDYLHAQNQGKLASVCLHRFSSIFESTIPASMLRDNKGKETKVTTSSHQGTAVGDHSQIKSQPRPLHVGKRYRHRSPDMPPVGCLNPRAGRTNILPVRRQQSLKVPNMRAWLIRARHAGKAREKNSPMNKGKTTAMVHGPGKATATIATDKAVPPTLSASETPTLNEDKLLNGGGGGATQGTTGTFEATQTQPKGPKTSRLRTAPNLSKVGGITNLDNRE